MNLPPHAFATFAATLKGDENGESQLFLIRQLEAFVHDGHRLPEGSRCAYRVRFSGENSKSSSPTACCSKRNRAT